MFFTDKLNIIKMFGINYNEEVKENDKLDNKKTNIENISINTHTTNNVNNINNVDTNNIIFNQTDNKEQDNNTNGYYKPIFNFGVYDFNNDTSLNLLNITYKSYNINDNNYKMLHYKKSCLNDDNIGSIGFFRSVLVENYNIIMFSPPKSLSYSTFIKKYNNIEKKCVIEEIVEGTMINLFFINGKWEISTKSTFGGNTKFYKNFDIRIYNENDINKTKTFRDMFFEVVNFVKLDINLLNKNYCYSFVMQHMDNRIVLPIYSMNLYLVKVYKIDNISKIVYEVEYKKDDVLIDILKNTSIKFPIKQEMTSFNELKNKYNSDLCDDTIVNNKEFNCLGVMIYSPDGCRTKIRNKIYEELKELRGNHPKLQYHYLNLRKQGNSYIKKYLYYFQEHEDLFNTYKAQLYDYTYTLYNNYINCYIKKEKKLKEYSKKYKTCMYYLHITYLNNLRPKKHHIMLSHVIEYVNNLDPKLQMYYLNYDMRQENN